MFLKPCLSSALISEYCSSDGFDEIKQEG